MQLRTTSETVAIAQVTQQFRALGLDIPDTLTNALEQIDRDLAPSKLTHDKRALVNAVAACLTADKDPALDKTVQAEVVRAQLAQLAIPDAIGREQSERRSAAFMSAAPDLLEALRPVVERADHALATMRETIPGTLDPSTVDVKKLNRPEQMAAWGHARDAQSDMRRVEDIWGTIASSAGLVPVDPRWTPLILAPLNADDLAGYGSHGNRAPAGLAVTLGKPLDLATPETFAERVSHVEQQRREAQKPAAVPARPSLARYLTPEPVDAA